MAGLDRVQRLLGEGRTLTFGLSVQTLPGNGIGREKPVSVVNRRALMAKLMLGSRDLQHDSIQHCISAGWVIRHNDSVAGVNSRNVASAGVGVMPAPVGAAA